MKLHKSARQKRRAVAINVTTKTPKTVKANLNAIKPGVSLTPATLISLASTSPRFNEPIRERSELRPEVKDQLNTQQLIRGMKKDLAKPRRMEVEAVGLTTEHGQIVPRTKPDTLRNGRSTRFKRFSTR